MTIRSIKNIWFDDAATSAMGEAFDHACKTLQDFGSAVPAIVANFIIAAAKNGERDPGRLYGQVLADAKWCRRTPVMLPSGCARFATRPIPTGSAPTAKTIGIV